MVFRGLRFGGQVRGWGYLFFGENNSLRSDIFSLSEKIPPPPTDGQKRYPEVERKEKVFNLVNPCCTSARGGRWIFRRKKVSERSEFFFQEKLHLPPRRPAPQPAGYNGGHSPKSDQLKSHSRPLATTNTQRSNPTLEATLLQGIHQGNDDPRT